MNTEDLIMKQLPRHEEKFITVKEIEEELKVRLTSLDYGKIYVIDMPPEPLGGWPDEERHARIESCEKYFSELRKKYKNKFKIVRNR